MKTLLPSSCQVGRDVLVYARAPPLQEQTRKEKQQSFVKETPSEILFWNPRIQTSMNWEILGRILKVSPVLFQRINFQNSHTMRPTFLVVKQMAQSFKTRIQSLGPMHQIHQEWGYFFSGVFQTSVSLSIFFEAFKITSLALISHLDLQWWIQKTNFLVFRILVPHFFSCTVLRTPKNTFGHVSIRGLAEYGRYAQVGSFEEVLLRMEWTSLGYITIPGRQESHPRPVGAGNWEPTDSPAGKQPGE